MIGVTLDNLEHHKNEIKKLLGDDFINEIESINTIGLSWMKVLTTKARSHPFAMWWQSFKKDIEKSKSRGSLVLSQRSHLLLNMLYHLKVIENLANIERIIKSIKERSTFYSAIFEAFVASAYHIKGYEVEIVMSDAVSIERRQMIKAFGAKVTLTEGKFGTDGAIMKARELVREYPQKYFMPDQFSNEYNKIAHYRTTGEEIWKQTKGKVDVFVHVVGSAASIKGITTILKKYNPNIKVFAVEPAESPVLLEGKSGSHGIGGIGIGFTPPLWDPNIADEIITISTNEAKIMARRLTREEGLFAGTSSGANVAAAIKVREKLDPDSTIVTLMVDSGLKYLSGDLFK